MVVVVADNDEPFFPTPIFGRRLSRGISVQHLLVGWDLMALLTQTVEYNGQKMSPLSILQTFFMSAHYPIQQFNVILYTYAFIT